MTLKQLHERADKLGLQAVGIAPAIKEVRAVFPWARSVVCAAISYLPPEGEEEHCHTVILSAARNPDPSVILNEVKNFCPRKQILRDAQDDTPDVPRGLVARFARGRDYHRVLRAKLSAVAEAMQSEHPGSRFEICVDTTPIPERRLAVLAGIARRGWNSNVFVEGCGSWVSLGEIVSDLAPPQSPPEKGGGREEERCKDCGLCIRNCPTHAITAPYTVDPARCLSAITQAPGEVSDEFKSKLGNRVYGCDICQEVCPRNVGIKPVTPQFAERMFPGAHPELAPLVEMSNADFKARVKCSSIGWIGRNRIRRNAVIALENLQQGGDDGV